MKKYLIAIIFLCFGLLAYSIIQMIFHDSLIKVIVNSIKNESESNLTKSSLLPFYGYKYLHTKNNALLDDLLLSNNVSQDLYETAVGSKTHKRTVSYPININTATAKDLENIPGIGPQLAKRIVEYRNANGAFTYLDQLLNVKGIGNKTLEKIKPFIIIN